MTEQASFAFVMPRDGVITSIAAYMRLASPLALNGTVVTITAQLYQATGFGDVYSPIPGTDVSLVPVLTGNLSQGAAAFGRISGLNIFVGANTRLMLAFTAEVTDGAVRTVTVSAFAGGGVTIE